MKSNLTIEECEKEPLVHVCWKPCLDGFSDKRGKSFIYRHDRNGFSRYNKNNAFQGSLSGLTDNEHLITVLETLTPEKQTEVLTAFPLQN